MGRCVRLRRVAAARGSIASSSVSRCCLPLSSACRCLPRLCGVAVAIGQEGERGVCFSECGGLCVGLCVVVPSQSCSQFRPFLVLECCLFVLLSVLRTQACLCPVTGGARGRGG